MTSKLALLALALATVTICSAGENGTAQGSLTTQERMYGSAWWPTSGEPMAKEYTGEAACTKCHQDISKFQNTTSMYRAATAAPRSSILIEHPLLRFKEGSYSYALERSADGVTYSVSDGNRSDSEPVAWAFGDGEAGQTYLLKKNDGYTESRLSYFTSPNDLDITTGHNERAPLDLKETFGHALSSDTAQRCFSCHTTAPVIAEVFVPGKAVPGVTCEACHGPGAKHVAAMSTGHERQAASTITNPELMSPANSVDFCGACHRTWADVAVFMPANLGAISVRFQPYRLEKSRCWGKDGDARITCIACHDPHKPLEREATFYDAKCLTCHGSNGQSQSGATVRSCKVSTTKCVSCHMPKYEIPQTHALFTDHEIRIVRTNAPAHTLTAPSIDDDHRE